MIIPSMNGKLKRPNKWSLAKRMSWDQISKVAAIFSIRGLEIALRKFKESGGNNSIRNRWIKVPWAALTTSTSTLIGKIAGMSMIAMEVTTHLARSRSKQLDQSPVFSLRMVSFLMASPRKGSGELQTRSIVALSAPVVKPTGQRDLWTNTRRTRATLVIQFWMSLNLMVSYSTVRWGMKTLQPVTRASFPILTNTRGAPCIYLEVVECLTMTTRQTRVASMEERTD